jgi:hypothetical protein
MLEKLKSGVYSHSTILDAVIYHRIGEDWNLELLSKICKEQYRQEVPAEKLVEIGHLSGMHYGIFKRLYRDSILGTNHTQVYIDSLLDDFSMEEINVLKKFVSNKSLSDHELKIKHGFELVGLIKDDKLTVPILAELITHYRIKGKIEVNEQNDKIKGLDLDLLTKGERAIVEQMMTAGGEISKDEIGDLIWGEKVNEYYSEWAIDQRMSRLKRKLADLGFNIDIKTIYGKGYQLIKIT